MKWFFALILLISTFFSGCTYNLSRPEYESEEQFLNEINEASEDRNVKIETRDSTFEAVDLRAGENSLHGTIQWDYRITPWNKGTAEKEFSIPNSAIHSVSVTKEPAALLKAWE